MPRKRKTDTAAIDADLFAAETVAEPVQMRERKPNPLEYAYLASREESTDGKNGSQKRVPPAGRVLPDEEAVKAALTFLRRAATEHNGGLRSRTVPETDQWGNEGSAVYFTWHTPSQRAYTSADVRTWAIDAGWDLPETGRVPAAVIRDYRLTHNLPVKEESAS